MLLPIGFLIPATVVLALRFGNTSSSLPAGLAMSYEGRIFGAELGIRTLACVSCTLLFIHATPLHVVTIALRRAGVPSSACDTILITARLVHLLGARLQALSSALLQRHGAISWRARLRSVSLMGATLLVDSLERSARLERGLGGRGGLGTDALARPVWLALHWGRLCAAAIVVVSVVLLGATAPYVLARVVEALP